MALRKFGTLNRPEVEVEVEDTHHEKGAADEPVMTAPAPEPAAASPAVTAKPPMNEYELAAYEALTQPVAESPTKDNAAQSVPPTTSALPPRGGSTAPSAVEDATAASALPEDENLGNDPLVARLKPEDRKEYDAAPTPEVKETILKAALARYEAEKRNDPQGLRPDDPNVNPYEQQSPPKPMTAADLVAGLMAAPAIAAVQAVAHAGSAIFGAASKGQRAYSERKLRNRIYESKMNELRANTGAMLDSSEKLGESVSEFNLAFLNSGAAAQLRKAAEAEGIDFTEMLTKVRDGKAKPEHLAIARDAMVDPAVSAAWEKVGKDHAKFQDAKSAISENCEMLSQNFAKRFDHEAVADNLREAGEVALSKVPDPVYENPGDPKLKEKMKEMLEQIQEMVRNLLNKIAETFRPK